MCNPPSEKLITITVLTSVGASLTLLGSQLAEKLCHERKFFSFSLPAFHFQACLCTSMTCALEQLLQPWGEYFFPKAIDDESNPETPNYRLFKEYLTGKILHHLLFTSSTVLFVSSKKGNRAAYAAKLFFGNLVTDLAVAFGNREVKKRLNRSELDEHILSVTEAMAPLALDFGVRRLLKPPTYQPEDAMGQTLTAALFKLFQETLTAKFLPANDEEA